MNISDFCMNGLKNSQKKTIRICNSPDRRDQFERKCKLSVWGGESMKEKEIVIVRGASTVPDDFQNICFVK